MFKDIADFKKELEVKQAYYLDQVKKENNRFLKGGLLTRIGSFITSLYTNSMGSANIYNMPISYLEDAEKHLQGGPSERQEALKSLQTVQELFNSAAENPAWYVGNKINHAKIKQRKAEFEQYKTKIANIIAKV